MTERADAPVRILAAITMAFLVGMGRAQEAGESHEFTGKSGQKIVARVLGVSEDRRQMRILRQDGMEFDTEIVIFSLDDQQYVKDWMKAQASGGTVGSAAAAMPKDSFRLEVGITRIPGRSEKHREEFYTMEENENLFRIAIRNLSRDTLTGAKLEYAIVWRDSVRILFDENKQVWDFSSRVRDTPLAAVKKLGEAALDPIRFNGEGVVETSDVSIDEVLYEGNELFGQDELVGVKVRVLAPDGDVLHESDFGGAAIAAMSWDEIIALEDPRPAN
ncbi:MAG: hypothetical protein B9S36_07015 [Verrucomicrobiia bacterium Tous-C2TDCM]|nr:MAG: hypothetical protein B9S36_07015 [Verrucomicrobiae bacterium Tous-C2TDCM]